MHGRQSRQLSHASATACAAHTLPWCCRYFVAFSFDTTLGVSIAILFHKAAVKWAKQQAAHQQLDEMTWQKALAECGSYGEWISLLLLTIIMHISSPSRIRLCNVGDPPSFIRFYIQLAEFSIAVIVGRVICGSLVRHHGLHSLDMCTLPKHNPGSSFCVHYMLLLLLILLLSVSLFLLLLPASQP